MVPFIKAEQLKKNYAAYGCFYHLELDGGTTTVPCRNVLEIVDVNIQQGGQAQLPDAIFIMMNPGKSEPLDDQFNPPNVKERNLNLIISQETLVPAKPEQTMYQLMRLMNYNGWRRVRVLNLSDIREPDAKKFCKLIQTSKFSRHMVHSIFSEKRTNERISAFERKAGAPIIAAWGKESFLIPLAKQCFAFIPKTEVLGLPCADDPWLYAHAAPSLQEQKQNWLDTIQQQVEKLK